MGSTPPRGASSALFTPLSIANGKIQLKHRIIMSPMTRNRGVPLNSNPTPEHPNRVWVADELIAKYYAQRATDGGLIVTESILPSPESGAMPGVPGLWLKEHEEGWKMTTSAVHHKGGIIYAQLTHQGRSSIPQMQGRPLVSSSATPWSTDEKYPYPPPGESSRVMYKDFPAEALTLDGIQRTIADHVSAAQMAMRAGFDGVELHGGNGYLLEQFLSSNVNKRTDDYGGSSEKRCRFVLELLEAVGKAVGEENVSLRLSPWGVYNDMSDEARWATWSYLCKEIKGRFPKISYVNFVEPRMEEREQFLESWGKEREISLKGFKEILQPIPVISAGGWDSETCWGAVEEGKVDGCVFARWFVSNPDLVARLRNGHPFSDYNRGKFYGPTSKREVGYTDYLTWEEFQTKEPKA